MIRQRWYIKKGYDGAKLRRSGHPWAYVHELVMGDKGKAGELDQLDNKQHSKKNKTATTPGEIVELYDEQDNSFHSYGFGNPKTESRIAFRSLTRRIEDKNPTSLESISLRLRQSLRLRKSLGYGNNHSYRLVFGEADKLPGLIIDRYAIQGENSQELQQHKQQQCFVIQPQSAGAEILAKGVLPEALKIAYELEHGRPAAWEEITSILFRKDSTARKYEGLPVIVDPIVHMQSKHVKDLGNCRIGVQDVSHKIDSSAVKISVDLLKGQKTGFYLDQLANINKVVDIFLHVVNSRMQEPGSGSRRQTIRILDVFSYVGHWSVQVANSLKHIENLDVEVTLVDQSSSALNLARRNVEDLAISAKKENCPAVIVVKEAIENDFIKASANALGLERNHYDCCIIDPPALIKSKNHIKDGTIAYRRTITKAINAVKSGGMLVVCSCSQQLAEDELLSTINLAEQDSKSEFQWVGRGGQALDHVTLATFPQGRYLKCFIGIKM